MVSTSEMGKKSSLGGTRTKKLAFSGT